MLKDATVHSPKVMGNENAENGSSGDKDEYKPQYQPNIPPRPLNSLQTASVSSIPSYPSLPAHSTKPITPAAPSVPHGPVALITSIIPSTPNNPRGLPTNESYVSRDVPMDFAASAREVQAFTMPKTLGVVFYALGILLLSFATCTGRFWYTQQGLLSTEHFSIHKPRHRYYYDTK
jgi:hypothetical protein